MANFDKKYSELSRKERKAAKGQYGSRDEWRNAKARSQGYKDLADKKTQRTARREERIAARKPSTQPSGSPTAAARSTMPAAQPAATPNQQALNNEHSPKANDVGAAAKPAWAGPQIDRAADWEPMKGYEHLIKDDYQYQQNPHDKDVYLAQSAYDDWQSQKPDYEVNYSTSREDRNRMNRWGTKNQELQKALDTAKDDRYTYQRSRKGAVEHQENQIHGYDITEKRQVSNHPWDPDWTGKVWTGGTLHTWDPDRIEYERKAVDHLGQGNFWMQDKARVDRNTRIGQWDGGKVAGGDDRQYIFEFKKAHEKTWKPKGSDKTEFYYEKKDQPMIDELNNVLGHERMHWRDFAETPDYSEVMQKYGVKDFVDKRRAAAEALQGNGQMGVTRNGKTYYEPEGLSPNQKFNKMMEMRKKYPHLAKQITPDNWFTYQ